MMEVVMATAVKYIHSTNRLSLVDPREQGLGGHAPNVQWQWMVNTAIGIATFSFGRGRGLGNDPHKKSQISPTSFLALSGLQWIKFGKQRHVIGDTSFLAVCPFLRLISWNFDHSLFGSHWRR